MWFIKFWKGVISMLIFERKIIKKLVKGIRKINDPSRIYRLEPNQNFCWIGDGWFEFQQRKKQILNIFEHLILMLSEDECELIYNELEKKYKELKGAL